MTVDIAPMMTEPEARRITERIRTALDRFSTSYADLAERVAEAYDRRADLALGYGSWAEYATAEFKPAEGLAASIRQQVVGLLSAQGMSTRAIAPVVGVSHMQVSNDRRAGVKDLYTSPERIDFATGEVITDVRGGTVPPSPAHDVEEQDTDDSQPSPAPRPAPIVGLDGKSYSRAEPKMPARSPLRDGFRDAALDLDKVVRRFERLVADDRYPRNRDEVARYANDIIRARDALDRLIGQMATTTNGKATS